MTKTAEERSEAQLWAERVQVLENEIERLQELLRGVGANRYWEGRWRDEVAEVERLRTDAKRMRNDIELRGWEIERLGEEIERLTAERRR